MPGIGWQNTTRVTPPVDTPVLAYWKTGRAQYGGLLLVLTYDGAWWMDNSEDMVSVTTPSCWRMIGRPSELFLDSIDVNQSAEQE